VSLRNVLVFERKASFLYPPIITVKHSLKNFSEQTLLIDLARVSWKDIDLILSVEDAWLFFKSAFLTILNQHAPKNVEPGTDIALGSLQTRLPLTSTKISCEVSH
jgi:hypothetical protein